MPELERSGDGPCQERKPEPAAGKEEDEEDEDEHGGWEWAAVRICVFKIWEARRSAIKAKDRQRAAVLACQAEEDVSIYLYHLTLLAQSCIIAGSCPLSVFVGMAVGGNLALCFEHYRKLIVAVYLKLCRMQNVSYNKKHLCYLLEKKHNKKPDYRHTAEQRWLDSSCFHVKQTSMFAMCPRLSTRQNTT